jgi:hypothetical protein
MSDYIPKREADLLKWAENFVRVVENYKNDLNIPTEEVTALKAALNRFSAALEDARSAERTPALVARKNAAKFELISLIRAMVRFRLQNPIVTPVMRIELGLKPRDETRTEHHDVPELVDFDLTLRGIREIVVNFRVKGSDSKAKPDGYDGAVLIWGILNEPPAEASALTRHTMASKTPHALKFTNEDRGKTVYIAAAWQNERGNIGDWSEILSAIVP